MISISDRAATQDRPPLDASPISPEQENQILKRKLLISNQVISILAGEIRTLKGQASRAAA
jgi:hypothetical protein